MLKHSHPVKFTILLTVYANDVFPALDQCQAQRKTDSALSDDHLMSSVNHIFLLKGNPNPNSRLRGFEII